MRINWLKVIYHTYKYGWIDSFWGCGANWNWYIRRFFWSLPVKEWVKFTYKDWCFIPYTRPDELGFYCWFHKDYECPLYRKFGGNEGKLNLPDGIKKEIMKVKEQKFLNLNGRFYNFYI